MKSAQEQNTSSVIPFRTRLQPRPRQLPGIEGFYVLTAGGTLGRYEIDGGFVKEAGLTDALASAIDTVLHRYRAGNADGLAIGVVTPSMPDSPWQSASLVFSDATLRSVYKTSNDPSAHLTSFQKRNKSKSLFRGMELLLDTMKTSQPESHRYCPVLFQPEVSNEILRRRYGVRSIDRNVAFEVLDMLDALPPEARRHSALAELIEKMRETRISPEQRSTPELKLIENSTDQGQTPEHGNSTLAIEEGTPWDNVRDQRTLDVGHGDPVTHWLLALFSPFNELNDVQRQFIARGQTVSRRPAGSTLIQRGSEEDVSIYLLKGTLELEAFDGKTMTIVGGTGRSRLPISQLRPHAYTVKALTDVAVMHFSQDMVREITRLTATNRNRPGIEVLEYEGCSPEGGFGYTTPDVRLDL